MSKITTTESGLTDSNTFEKGFFCSEDTYVHHTSILGPNVSLGKNVKIGPYCTVIGNVSIGSNTKIYQNVCIGFPAQDVGTSQPLGKIEIGENCNIREFTTIHSSKKNNGVTFIGNNCYIMNFCHIAHDVVMGNNVILINNVNIGGHSIVQDGVMLMANSAVHQFCKIGRLSCLTPYSGTRQDLPPFCMFAGQPGKFSGLNTVALKRASIPGESIDAIKHVSKLFYQDKISIEKIKNLDSTNLDSKTENESGFTESGLKDSYAREFLDFLINSERGVSRKVFSYKTARDS